MIFPRRVAFGLLLFLVIKLPSYSQCIATSSTSVVTVCSGNLPFFWNHTYFDEPGNYSVRLSNSVLCDSIANLILYVTPSGFSSSDLNICSQDFPYRWHGKVLPAPDVYMDTTSSYLGCDSVISLNLKVSNIWTGAASNYWEDINNWSCHALPDSLTDVVINSGIVQVNSNQTVRSLTVSFGAFFTVAPGFDIHITSAGHFRAPVYLTKYKGYGFNGESIEIRYYYDSLNRLESEVTNVFPPPPGGDIHYPDSLVYYYYSGDSLPYKAAHNGGYDPVEYYIYDNQKRISRFVYSSAEGLPIPVDYTYPGNEIVITDTFGLVRHLVYDGNNVTYDNWAGSPGFTMEHNNLNDPFSLVSINRHIPYGEGWITRGETYLNKNAVSQTTSPDYQVVYQYNGIVNNLPRYAKLRTVSGSYSYNMWQFFYYSH